MNRILLDIGLAFEDSDFQRLCDDSVYLIDYLGDQKHIDHLRNTISSDIIEYISYERLYSYNTANNEYKFGHDIVTIIDKIVNDKITIDLYDRCLAPYFFNYSTKTESVLVKMIISSFKFLMDFKPKYFVLYECPHNINTWVVGRVAEIIGIPVRYCRNNALPWRNVLLEGMSKNAIMVAEDRFNENSSPFEIDLFLDIEGRYTKGTNAIKPEYMEVMKEQKSNKVYSLYRDIKKNWMRPEIVLYKYLCYKNYSKLCSYELQENYIVFFLHLQPERTTLPEGYGFQSQYKAISILNELIPNNWHILVKEHPATFYTHCSPFGRWFSFYEELNSLSKVRLIPLETDPYEIIKNAKCVSTITGTVGSEALLMGKPVINFGLNSIQGALPYGMYNFVDMQSLKAFISHILDFHPEDIRKGYREVVISTILNAGLSGIYSKEEWDNGFATRINSNKISRYKLLHNLLAF